MNGKKIIKGLLLGSFLAALVLTAAAQKHPRELGPAPELNFKLTKPVMFTLSNGIQCFFMEDKELPLISLRGLIKGGSYYEPADKTGLASLVGQVLRTGGTKTRTGDQINEELEFIAASVESFTNNEYLTVSGSSLKKDFAKLIEIYADILLNPEFRQDKLDLAKNQTYEAMRRRWDQPMQVAMLLFNEKMYGADTPFGRRSTPASVKAIGRDDLISFYRAYSAPNNFTLGITGDLSLNEAKAALEKAFRNWAKKKVTFAEVASPVEKADGTIYYAFKETPQGNVFMGHLGIAQKSPDEYKVEVMNDILGGGSFTARLMKELRSNRGLTYGIYGGVYEGTGKHRGVFQIGSQLKAAKFVEAVETIKSLIKDIQTNPVTDEEMTTSRNSLINSFVFRFEQKSQILAQYMSLKMDGYPDNYLETYIDNIRKVTKADIQAAARQYMNPEKMILIVVGNEKLFDKPLSSLGQVATIDIKALQEAEKIQ
ncbi:MAG: pitrilysin family protein [Acidobacteriota bacterium]|nr:pitrilysin family protein [Acidobacteriota bacterium]